MWKQNPSWNESSSGAHENENLEGRNSVLTFEYLSSLIAAIRIFESSVKQNSAKDRLSEMYKGGNTKRSVSVDTQHEASADIHLAFGDPQVAILNSPGVFIFEACTSAIGSYSLVDRYPQAAD